MVTNDNVNHPSHYCQGGIECIDAIESATVNKTGLEAVCVANVIKYLFRYENKNGLEDVYKAQFYLNKLISHLEKKPKTDKLASDPLVAFEQATDNLMSLFSDKKE